MKRAVDRDTNRKPNFPSLTVGYLSKGVCLKVQILSQLVPARSIWFLHDPFGSCATSTINSGRIGRLRSFRFTSGTVQVTTFKMIASLACRLASRQLYFDQDKNYFMLTRILHLTVLLRKKRLKCLLLNNHIPHRPQLLPSLLLLIK